MKSYVKNGDCIAYDKTMIAYQLMPQDFSRFVGQLVLMDDDAVGAEEPSWLEVVELERINSNGDITIHTGEGCHETISKRKLVKHSGCYVAFYAIKPEILKELENAPESAVVVSEEYTKAVTLTKEAIAHISSAESSLIKAAKILFQVKEEGLYKELGYSNFKDYCDNEVKFKHSQAMKLLAIYKRNPESSRLDLLGIEKTYLLTMLDEPDRQALMETHDVENMTVKELKEAKAQIKQLKDERAEMIEHHVAEQGDFLRKIDQLQGRVQQLESRPVDMHSEKDAQKIKQLKEELEAVTEERDLKEKARLMLLHKWQESKGAEKALQKELDKLKAKPPETVTTEDTSRIEELKSKIEDLKQQLAEKPAIQESLSGSDGEFDAYFRMFDDALKHMTTYLFRKDCTDFLRRQSISMIETKFEKYISALKEERK